MNCCQNQLQCDTAENTDLKSCSACGEKGKPVDRITVEHILNESLVREIQDTQYYFCRTSECDVVYFSNQTGQRFSKSDVRIRVGLKEKADPVSLCYCFGHTKASVREEIARTGRSAVAERIAAEIQAGRCECEIKNPSGSCCLGEVRQAVKALLKESLALASH